MSLPPVRKRSLASIAVLVALAMSAGACTTSGTRTATAQNPAAPGTPADVAEAVRYWGPRFERSPGDEQTAFAYSRALLAQDQRTQAVAVLRRAVLANQSSRFLKGELGKALAANGELQESLTVFAQAHTPDRPDWRLLSAQGAVLDQLGRSEEAKRTYESALRIAPNEPSVLSNYGLSLALAGDLPGAERQLRRAVELPGSEERVRQNLAMVVGLQGRFQEAETIAKKDLPPEQAERNVAMIRRMLSERNTWANIRSGTPPAATTRTAEAVPTRPRGIPAAQVLAEQAAALSAQRPAQANLIPDSPSRPPETAAAPTGTQAAAQTSTQAAPAPAASSGGQPTSLLTTGTTRRERVSPAQAQSLLGAGVR